MIYGSINADGSINTGIAYSNNFTVNHAGLGHYQITINAFMVYAPLVVVTPIYASGHVVSAACSIDAFTGKIPTTPHVIDVYTFGSQNGSAMNAGFNFQATPGRTVWFDLSKGNDTLTLTPEVVTWQGAQVLVLSTTIDRAPVYLDRGTGLLGFSGTTLTLEIAASFGSSPNAWTVAPYTYGVSGSPSGNLWTPDRDENPTKYTHTIDLTRADSSSMSSPELFLVQATKGATTINADPRVRITTVPPALAFA